MVYGLSSEEYERLKGFGVSHRLMKTFEADPKGTLEFYRTRVAMGKSFAEVAGVYQSEVLDWMARKIKEAA